MFAVTRLLVFGLAGAGALAAFHSVAYAEGYKTMSMKDDLANRSPDIHWPAGFAPDKADLFAHNDLIINASCERVWSHIIDAKRWPIWYPNSKDVELPGGNPVLRDGTVFRWTTFGLTIESTVHEFVPNQRLGWFGYAPGAKPSFYHSWYLEPKGDMCHVVMDEAGVGKDAAGLRNSDETLMHRGHDLWLATLKWVAEAK
jgi:Polyketide cyclase / dehydrase and lipid transport